MSAPMMYTTEQSVMAVIRAARPTFRNAHDKVAFAVHATLFASGFVLRAAGPDAVPHHAQYANYHDEVDVITNWNQLDANYAFVYSTPWDPSGFNKLVVKYALGDYLHVDALKTGFSHRPEVISQMEINVKDHVKEEINNTNKNINYDDKYNYRSMFKDFGELVKEVDNEIVRNFVSCPLRPVEYPFRQAPSHPWINATTY